MFKKTLLAVSVGLVFSMSGCGGGGSDDPVTGTGYYVDSAVSGVKTKCGAKEGTTGADGKFTFEVGKGCTFFLGDIKLRDIDKAILKDGVTVYETDKYTAQVLQSLDSDGNPDNGITISDEFVTALATANITTLPTNEAETTAMLAVIETAGGTIVSQTDAQAHSLQTLIVNRTLYPVGNNGENPNSVGEINYMPNGIVNYPDGGSDSYTIVGNKIFQGDANEYYEFKEQRADYILFQDHDDNAGTTRLYFDKTKAEAYLATLSPQPTEFTTALLAGKTFYNVMKNSSNGSSQPETCILEHSYTSTTFTKKEWVYHSASNWTSGCNEDFGDASVPYLITGDGKVELQTSEKWWFKLDSIKSDYYEVTDPDGAHNWYFTKAKANEVAGS